MNQPKDYAPHLTLSDLAESKANRLERQAKLQRWASNALLFMSGIAAGTIIIGSLCYWGLV